MRKSLANIFALHFLGHPSMIHGYLICILQANTLWENPMKVTSMWLHCGRVARVSIGLDVCTVPTWWFCKYI